MSNPRLLHPIPVYVRKKDTDFTAVYDHNLKEPIGQVRREQKPVKLVAQIQEGLTNRARAELGGVSENSDGYVLFRTSDLRDKRIEIERGDRIVQIGEEPNERETDYYVISLKYMGHYQSAKGATLLRAYYEDRQPSRVR